MATKTQTVTVTGILARCITKDEPAFDYNYTHKYAPSTDHRCKYLDCSLVTPDGQTYYFSTPHFNYNITSSPGLVIITFPEFIRTRYPAGQSRSIYEFPPDHPWFTLQDTKATATPGHYADKTIVSKFREGDTITVQGRIKKTKISQTGKPYTVLNYVRRKDPIN